MNDRQWDKQLVDFLKRTGEELKRTGEEVKREAQRLLDEVRDPETQAKMKESFANFGTWAKKTAEDAAQMIEVAVDKAEGAIKQASSKVRGDDTGTAAPAAPRAAAAAPAAKKPAAPRAKKPVAKTMGRAKAGGSRKPPPTRAPKTRKTVGKKR